MKKEGNTTPPKAHNFSITEAKDTKIVKMLDKELKTPVLEMNNDLKKRFKQTGK
jgi:hypothetical protein